MNNLTQFMVKDNINLLWDVLLDELHINQTNKSLMSNIRVIFESNIKPFSSRINPSSSIMELNKLFLSQVVLAVNRLLFPKEKIIKRIKIEDEEVSEPYKIEDIQSSRQSEFEKELEKKRLDLENYMTPQKPKELDFSDKATDGKITAMDSLVAQKMTQRNLEIEQFQNSNYNTTDLDPEKWLLPKETSIKEEKNMYINNSNTNNSNNNNNNNNNIKLKYITPDGNILDKKVDKKVTWNETTNIFQKLKKVDIDNPINDSNMDNPINNSNSIMTEPKQYVQQNSIPLPEVKSEIFVSTNNNNIQNTPIIPINEIVKQMNEMTAKINNLNEMITKLTKLMEDKGYSTDININ